MGADRQSYLAAYEKAQDPAERRFAGIFYILHHPESRPYLSSGVGRVARQGKIDDFRDNWWCPVNIATELDARGNIMWNSPREDADSPQWSTAFLSDDDRREAAEEMSRLAATKSGPDYLLRETMTYARAHPRDPRIPEALHYALRSQRYGCVGKQTAASAEAAWRYLWRKYPRNPWTRKTNYDFEPENLPGSPRQ